MRLVDADKVIQMEGGEAVDYLISAEPEYDVKKVLDTIDDKRREVLLGAGSSNDSINYCLRCIDEITEIVRNGGKKD